MIDVTERYAQALSASADALAAVDGATEKLADAMDESARLVRRLGVDREDDELVDAAVEIGRRANETRRLLKMSPMARKLIEKLGRGKGGGGVMDDIAQFAFKRLADVVAEDILNAARERAYAVMSILDAIAEDMRGDAQATSWIEQLEDAVGEAHGAVESAVRDFSDSMGTAVRAGDVPADHDDETVVIDLPDMGQALFCHAEWEDDARVRVTYELQMPSYALTGSDLSIVNLDTRVIEFETVLQANMFSLDDYAEENAPEIPADVEREWQLDYDLTALDGFVRGRADVGRDLAAAVRAYDEQEGTSMTSYEGELAEYAKRAGWDFDLSHIGQEPLPLNWGR